MSHLDDDRLAGSAIGDALTHDELAHLADCAECAAALQELQVLAARAGSAGGAEPLTAPPARVWDAIATQIRADALEFAGDDGDLADATPSDAALPASDSPADVIPLRRPRRRWLVVAAAAAAGAVVGGVGVTLWLARTPDTTVVASADIVLLADDSPIGTAEVVERSDGSQELVLDGSYSSVDGADLEVWLIDPNIEGMVSLGFLSKDAKTFAIPEGYAIADFPIVDVSVEPRDGLPTHSGDSVARGVLEKDPTAT